MGLLPLPDHTGTLFLLCSTEDVVAANVRDAGNMNECGIPEEGGFAGDGFSDEGAACIVEESDYQRVAVDPYCLMFNLAAAGRVARVLDQRRRRWRSRS